MGKNGIPDRWLPYSAMGSIVPGTRFIACKVPLKDGLLRSLPEKERFGPKDLLEAFPKIGLLIDLTNTTRYYFKQDFTDKDIRYEKIFCPGKVVPPNSIIKQFYEVVDDYLASETDPDAVIVVHCTHGVNRTGYFICRYMIERLNMSPEESVKNFQMARGHDIERDTYVSDLKNGCKGGKESDLCFASDRGFRGGGRGRRGDRHNRTYLKRDFNFVESYGREERNNYNKNYNDYNYKGQPRNGNNKYFNNFDRKTNAEEKSKYAYNWRNHDVSPHSSYSSTTPHQHNSFAPTHHQESSRSPYQPSTFPRQEHPSSSDSSSGPRHSKRGKLSGPPPKSFSKNTYKEFSPLPKFGVTETYNDDAPSSLLKGNSLSNPDNPYFSHGKKKIVSSEFRGQYRGRSGRGQGRGRGRGNGDGSSSWKRGGNTFSR